MWGSNWVAGAVVLAAMAVAPGTAHAAWPGADGLLAATEIEDGRDAVVVLVSPDGAKTVLVDSDGQDAMPTFDPSGTRLAYVHAGFEDGVPTVVQVRERLIADPASDRLVAEAPDDARFLAVEYTADGEHLLVQVATTDERGFPDDDARIVRMNRNGGDQEVVLSGIRAFPPFTSGPGGTFASRPGDPETESPPQVVRATPGDTGGQAVPLDPPSPRDQILDVRADGQAIAYGSWRGDESDCDDVFEAPPAGGDGVRRGSWGCRLRALAYAPAGGRAALVGGDDDGRLGPLGVLDLATGTTAPLAEGMFASVDWQPRPRLATTLTADPAVASVLAPGTAVHLKLSAVLRHGSTPLAGRKITFTTPSGGTLCVATTAATGRASCTGLAPLLSSVLSLGYRARYAGDSEYLPASASAPILKVGKLRIL